MTIIDEYLEQQEKYEKLYGEYTIVLMQIGHFYECYAIDNELEKTNATNIYRLSDIMNIQLTRKNKSITQNSRGNPIMIGVNIYSLDKYVQILINANYTIVVIEQVTPPPEPERAVTNIFSPGTTIQHINKGDTNYLMSIFIDSHYDIKTYKEIIFVGMSCVDLSTGKNQIYETHSVKNDISLAYDEAFRFIQSTNPKEIILVNKNTKINNNELAAQLDLTNRVVHFKEIDEINKQFFKINYQSQYLKKIFKNTGLLSPIEYLDLETKPNGLISYLLLLDFAYHHNENIINKLEKPEINDKNKFLILTNNSINQLNIVCHYSQTKLGKFNSLYGVINNASTSIGKRNLKEQLLNPILDVEELNKRYNFIDAMIENDTYKIYENYLNKIVDLERLHRRLGLKMLQPADFSGLHISYSYIRELFQIVNPKMDKLKPNQEHIIKFEEFIKEYSNDFDLDEIIKYHIDKINNSFFRKGINDKLDSLQDEIDKSKEIMKAIAKKLSNLVANQLNTAENNFVKLEHNDKNGYYLVVTTKRSQLLKKSFQNMNFSDLNIETSFEKLKINPKDFEFKINNSSKTSTKIIHKLIKTNSDKLVVNQEKMHYLCKDLFLKKCEYYYDKYYEMLKNISDYIGNIDVIKSNAKTAITYGYSKPIIKTDSNKSFLNVKNIRHPIIERLQNKDEYITNDVILGTDDNNQEYLDGMLLYGTNASGKSSLMKAIGLNIIMAQAGMYVPCEKLEYKPYNYIFTRINNNDNIFKGESSFAIEMSELRSILKRTNENSLVLGDELCSGTESISAQSIFASSVMHLVKKKTSFIFATHLHELNKLEQITSLESVKMFHLKVVFDNEKGKLIYDRKLETGSGPAIYGLEVCKSMDMDKEFIENAQNIRKQLLNQTDNLLHIKKSNYNTQVFVDLCEVCSLKAEDVHHIKFQCTADKNKMIGHIQKDVNSNLVPLCKKCHNEVHNGRLNIEKYVKTSDGIELKFNYIDDTEHIEKKQKRKKITPEQVSIIRELYNNEEYKKVNRDFIIDKLNKSHNISISKNTLSKIINNKY